MMWYVMLEAVNKSEMSEFQFFSEVSDTVLPEFFVCSSVTSCIEGPVNVTEPARKMEGIGGDHRQPSNRRARMVNAGGSDP